MQPRTQEVLDYLDASNRALDDAVATVPETLRGRRPAPERWSVAEIVEHLNIVEGTIIRMLEQQLESARAGGLGVEQRAEPVVPTLPIARLLDRDAKIAASERSQPKDGLTWQAAREAVAAVRARTRALLHTSDGLAVSELVIPHPVLGPLNVYQWIVFVAAHERRHASQIREVGAALSQRA